MKIMNGRKHIKQECINSLKRNHILNEATDNRGNPVKVIYKKNCGNKSWGMIDFLQHYEGMRFIFM